MGDDGNNFFDIKCAPNFGKRLLTCMLHAIVHLENLEESAILLISIFSVTDTAVFNKCGSTVINGKPIFKHDPAFAGQADTTLTPGASAGEVTKAKRPPDPLRVYSFFPPSTGEP